MKKILLIAFAFLNLKTFGQDMIYLTNGNSVPGKITEITKDSVKFKNLISPSEQIFTYAAANIQFAFNAAGNYLFFSPTEPFTDKVKHEFLEANARLRPFDIVVDLNGKLSTINITSETESKISDGKVNMNKDSLAYVIRKNSNHELFCGVDRALPYLINFKAKIDSLLPLSLEIPPVASIPNENSYVVPDMQLIGRRAFEKVLELTESFQAIISGKTERYFLNIVMDSNRNPLFINHGNDTRVEVTNKKTGAKTVYKLRDYLNRLVKKAGQFDKLNVAYMDIDYATEFRRGPDGNYFATITFVQKIQGFNDGNVVYSNQAQQNMVITLQHMSGPNPDGLSGWIIYLDNIGVVETEKL